MLLCFYLRFMFLYHYAIVFVFSFIFSSFSLFLIILKQMPFSASPFFYQATLTFLILSFLANPQFCFAQPCPAQPCPVFSSYQPLLAFIPFFALSLSTAPSFSFLPCYSPGPSRPALPLFFSSNPFRPSSLIPQISNHSSANPPPPVALPSISFLVNPQPRPASSSISTKKLK